MYSIPESFNPNIFKGESVSMICFNTNQIYLHTDSTTICFSGKYTFKDNMDKMSHFDIDEEFPISRDNGLLKLLEKEIVDAKTDTDRKNLHLEFSDNMSLVLIGSDEWESYRITIGEIDIII